MAFLKIVTLATLALGALAAPVEVEKRAYAPHQSLFIPT